MYPHKVLGSPFKTNQGLLPCDLLACLLSFLLDSLPSKKLSSFFFVHLCLPIFQTPVTVLYSLTTVHSKSSQNGFACSVGRLGRSIFTLDNIRYCCIIYMVYHYHYHYHYHYQTVCNFESASFRFTRHITVTLPLSLQALAQATN